MTPQGLKRLREKKQLSQAELCAIINASLGTSYGTGSLSPWETGRRPIPASVDTLLDELAVDANLQPLENEQPPQADGEQQQQLEDEDTAPGPGPVQAQPPLTSGHGTWERACTELWEMIASGVGMAGAAAGNPALMQDGAIIQADSEALGKAWARLAETNETFRKMLVGMTEGGAWLQVAMVTGTTVSKCYQNHAYMALQAAQAGPDGASAREHPAAA